MIYKPRLKINPLKHASVDRSLTISRCTALVKKQIKMHIYAFEIRRPLPLVSFIENGPAKPVTQIENGLGVIRYREISH